MWYPAKVVTASHGVYTLQYVDGNAVEKNVKPSLVKAAPSNKPSPKKKIRRGEEESEKDDIPEGLRAKILKKGEQRGDQFIKSLEEKYVKAGSGKRKPRR